MQLSRPNFKTPPLVEQAISIGFEPLQGFRIVDYGLFWQEIASEFPQVETETPIEAVQEKFAGGTQQEVSLHFLRTPPLPRAMFRNPANGELIQVQKDRFGFNWAKVEDQPYPRSEPLMERFCSLFERFGRYIEGQGLGTLQLQQCELTNLNILPVADFGKSYADLSNALQIDPIDFRIPFLEAEAVERSRQLRILDEEGGPIGRLHMVVAPVVSNLDNSAAYRFELTARSAPNINSIKDALKFFATARDAINSAFTASVTDTMKEKWGYADGK